MKAIGYTHPRPLSDTQALIDIDLPQPRASGHDLLVRINAIAVNPVDFKVRQNVAPADMPYKVLGWDAVGEVVATGELVSRFRPGDTVFYAGDLNRQGSNAEYQLVEEHLVGHKPKSLEDAEAAALPLTAITAWELLFEHLDLGQLSPDDDSHSDEVLLVVGAAGGVGSILLQLAKAITGASIVATASRERSKNWVKSLGADHVIDHTRALKPQIEALGIGAITHVASLNSTDSYFDSYVDLMAPFGKIALIDDPVSLDISKLKMKSLSLHWEFMFARSMYAATDRYKQGELLNRIAELVDQNYIKTTVGEHLGSIDAANLRRAHQMLESGQSIGKIVLEGF